MKNLYSLLAFIILLAGNNLYSQNDTLYAMKAGLIINKQSVTKSNADSIIFYKPTVKPTNRNSKGNLSAVNLSQNDTLYIMKAGAVINKQSVKTVDLDSIIFYKPSINETLVCNDNVKIIAKKQ